MLSSLVESIDSIKSLANQVAVKYSKLLAAGIIPEEFKQILQELYVKHIVIILRVSKLKDVHPFKVELSKKSDLEVIKSLQTLLQYLDDIEEGF